MKNAWLVGVLFVAVSAHPVVASADASPMGAKYTLSCTKHYTSSVWTHEDGYLNRAKHKLIFGGKNTLLGFMELYNEPRDAARDNRSMVKGIGHGLKNTIADTIGGALHVVTFPVTVVDVPLPEGGTDIL